MMNWIKKLKNQGACPDGLDWASKQESPQAAWSACERADWMLWAWGRNCGKQGSESHRQLVLVGVEIAKTSIKCIEDKEVKKVVKNSLDTTERWAKGEEGVTLEDVANVSGSAWSAAASAFVDNPNNAGYASSAAVWYAGYAVSYFLGVVSVAWYAGRAAAAAAAAAAIVRSKALKEYADIISKIQPDCPKFKK